MEDKYIISDVSKLLDIEPHVLRYWEEELALNISRNQLGHRYYNVKDLETLKKIKSLKEQGYQLRAIKLVLNSSNYEKDINMDKSDVGIEEKESKLDSTQESNETKKELELTQSKNSVESYNNKLKQFELFFKDVVYMSLQENNKLLKEEISDAFLAKMQPMVMRQEELDEKHYRKLDETIREIQKVRQEIAAAKPKKWFKRKTEDDKR